MTVRESTHGDKVLRVMDGLESIRPNPRPRADSPDYTVLRGVLQSTVIARSPGDEAIPAGIVCTKLCDMGIAAQ